MIAHLALAPEVNMITGAIAEIFGFISSNRTYSIKWVIILVLP
jgi:hypothetical protein